MLRQYLEVKAKHPDTILFYRMGDFFEMFFEDAEKAAPILEIALTARQKGTENEAPMCGVPHHALENYLGKLVRAGFKVAICDQVEDPAKAKGLVRREVTRVVTPGTLSEPELLEGKEDNLLCAVRWQEAGGAGAFLDVSTGKLVAHAWGSPAAALEELSLLRPRELLFTKEECPPEITEWAELQGVCRTLVPEDEALRPAAAKRILEGHFQVSSLRGFGLSGEEPTALAAAAALTYAQETQHSDLSHIADLHFHQSQEFLLLDDTTLQNLEVLRSQRGEKRRGTLLAHLDETRTAMGGRRLRSWLLRPLLDREQIRGRHDAVEELVEDRQTGAAIGRRLARVADIERLLSRAVLGSLRPREAGALRDSLIEIGHLVGEIASCRSGMLVAVAGIEPAEELRRRLEVSLTDEPPTALRQGGVIAGEVNEELDRCRSLLHDSKQHIVGLEARERDASGIQSLKVGYNRVFGYYLEVKKSNQAAIPSHYVRKQTLSNAERYITPEIKELEEEILGAEGRVEELEREEYALILAAIVAAASVLRELATAVSELDALAALAEVATRHRYCRPRMLEAGEGILIREGRHPVVEALLREEFVPNDTELGGEDAQIVLLTGPNMGGKSTYLRQVALIVLMAQAGSFIPAASAEIGVVDRVFSRVGASDDLTRGESTFMLEMLETSNILRYASSHSLVILDEVGRGTATFDGLSLAWAIVEYLHDVCGPKTLFATHYHELTELASLLPRVANRTMAVKEWDERIVFLRRVVAGSAERSYGIQVARLAGLPPPVLERASEILENLERQEYDLTGTPRLAQSRSDERPRSVGQMALFAPPEELVASILRDLDVDQLSPLAALNLLHTLKSRLTEPPS